MNLRKQLRSKMNKKGFTLIEIVVVLLILAILAAIAIPMLTGYVEDAKDSEDYAKIGLLNRSSSAARAYVYNEDPTQKDVFAGISDNKKRQEKLMEYNLLDELLVSRKGNYFYWNVDKQLWELTDGSGSSTPTITDDGTIMDQGRDEDIPAFISGKYYSKGEYFTIGDKKYKVLSDNLYLTDSNYKQMPIKEIKLEYDTYNRYEFGDIIQYNGKYYKASKQTSNIYEYQNKLPDDQYSEHWKEVTQSSDKTWTEVE